jgi:choline kinase
MKCLILAAGQGSRLRSVAEVKPLARIAGMPLIRHVMQLARLGGATEFVVVTGYRADRLEAELARAGEWTGAKVTLVHNQEWRGANGTSVLAAAPELDGPFIILMSDHLFDPAMLRRLIENADPDAALTLAVDFDVANPELDLDDATKVKLDSGDRIVEIGKALTDYDAIDTGIFLATPALVEAIGVAIESGGAGSLSEGVQALAREGRARALDCSNHWWLDVDDAAALIKAKRDFPAALSSAGQEGHG